ncbi:MULTISPECIES: arginase [Thermus]|uniref:Arginase n=4 Tax=Thermus TaxID=270 RepID=H7GHE2_9DEIN|nr:MULTISPECIES: arginase [Thermus]AEG33914.1 arginase [Thermus thermophilus SG0.5JP17-16]AFH38454.1 arginase [Thermus thermophilus JL-18]AMA75282.1 arginase [Thermus parvatiensis]EIA38672.1 arginase [Thermus parvatiensis]VCU52401.1 Arginase [Thermus thermophilus]
MPPMERVAVVGVPMDLGANRRGVDMGPSALRYARLLEQLEDLGYTVEDLGDVPVSLARASRRRGRGLAYLEEIRAAALALKERLAALPEGVFPIVLGGDHSLSMGSVAGAARGRRVGVVWVDAHADFNTPETSPSGNVHGMPLAVLSGLGHPRLTEVFRAVDPKDVVLVGVRSLDPGEKRLLKEAGVRVYTMHEVDRLGVARIAEEVLKHLQGLPLHVSLDADVLDPTLAPGVGTPVPGGLTYREAHLLMEILAESGRVQSLDLVEVNPILDERNRTAEMLVGLALSLLGKRIF